MKLNLDFSLYKGTTRLKQWWKEVLSHFTQVQEAHNALDTALSDEVADRTNGDSNLQTQLNTHTASRGSSAVYGHVKLSDSVAASSSTATAATPAAVKTAYDKAAQGVNDAAAVQTNLDTEVSNRQSADGTLQQNINAEAAGRQSADTTLQQNINSEASARTAADNALSSRVAVVEGKAHTHSNKTVLDGITAADIENWNGILEQVTQTQLNEAIAAEAAERTEADNGIINMLNAVKAYFEDICFGFTDELQRVYAAIGITAYDGGIFGQEQDGAALDGGVFSDTDLVLFDCGGFEAISAGTSVDGGTY